MATFARLARKTLTPWVSMTASIPEAAAKRRNVIKLRNGQQKVHLFSSLYSTMFADNNHLAHIRINDWAALPPQFETEGREQLSSRLVANSPVDRENAGVWYDLSGAQAISTAIWDSTKATGAPGVFRMDPSYHGSSLHASHIGTDPRNAVKTSTGHMKAVVAPPLPRPMTEAQIESCLDQTHQLFAEHTNCKTLIIEGSSGTVEGTPYPVGYVPKLIKLARDHKIRIIADEVMSGLMRCGAGLCAAIARDDLDIKLDYVCYGKVLANGSLPMSATVVSDAKDRFTNNPWEHGTTFSGFTVGIDAANATLDRLDASIDDILELTAWCKNRMARFENLATVRGQGLLWTVTLDNLTNQETAVLVNYLYECGVMVGHRDNRLIFAPSLDSDHLDEAMEMVEAAVCEAHQAFTVVYAPP